LFLRADNFLLESAEFVDAPDIEMDDVGEVDRAEEEAESLDLPIFLEKVEIYSRRLYEGARKDTTKKSARKYSRKLFRLARRFRKAQGVVASQN
jgi:hypothetical protein